LEQKHGALVGRGFPPSSRCQRIPEGGEFDVVRPLETLSLSAKAFSLALAIHILLPQGVLRVHGKANCESRKNNN